MPYASYQPRQANSIPYDENTYLTFRGKLIDILEGGAMPKRFRLKLNHPLPPGDYAMRISNWNISQPIPDWEAISGITGVENFNFSTLQTFLENLPTATFGDINVVDFGTGYKCTFAKAQTFPTSIMWQLAGLSGMAVVAGQSVNVYHGKHTELTGNDDISLYVVGGSKQMGVPADLLVGSLATVTDSTGVFQYLQKNGMSFSRVTINPQERFVDMYLFSRIFGRDQRAYQHASITLKIDFRKWDPTFSNKLGFVQPEAIAHSVTDHPLANPSFNGPNRVGTGKESYRFDTSAS